MSRKKRKRPVKRTKAKESKDFFQNLKKRWEAKSPILKFVLGFGAMMILFYIVITSPFFVNSFQPTIARINASVSNFILLMLGQGTSATGPTISSSEFSISVALGCDAIEPCAIFMALILAFPVPFSNKMRGLMFGLVFLLSLNIIRVVSLYLVGRYFPDFFHVMHLDVWQVIFIFFAILSWAVWMIWSARQLKRVQHAKA